MPETFTGLQLVSFVGRQGSGKTLLGKKLAHALSVGRVEVSDVVRKLNKGLSREELPGTAKRTAKEPDWLVNAVQEEILRVREECGGKIVVLSGVRERTLHKGLKHFGASIWSFEVTCPAITRCERLHRLGKVSTVEEFLAHEMRETQMGIRQVLKDAPVRVLTDDTSDPDTLIKPILSKLKDKGMKL